MIAIINRKDGSTLELYQKKSAAAERIIVKQTLPENLQSLAFNVVDSSTFDEMTEGEIFLDDINDDNGLDELNIFDNSGSSEGEMSLDDLLGISEQIENNKGQSYDSWMDLESEKEEKSLSSEWAKVGNDPKIIVDRLGRPVKSQEDLDLDDEEDEESSEDEDSVKMSGKLMDAVSSFVKMSNYNTTPQGTMVRMEHKNPNKTVKDEDGKLIMYDFNRRTVIALKTAYLKCNVTGEIVKVVLKNSRTVEKHPTLPDGRQMTFETSKNDNKVYVLYTPEGEKLYTEKETKVMVKELPGNMGIFYKRNNNDEMIVDSSVLKKKLDQEPYKSIYEEMVGDIDEDKREKVFRQLLKDELAKCQVKKMVKRELTSSMTEVKLKEKLEYGNKTILQEISVIVNDVVNLNRDSSQVVDKTIVNHDGKSAMLTQFQTKKGTRFYELSTLTGTVILRRQSLQDGMIEVKYSDDFKSEVNKLINYDRIYTMDSKNGAHGKFNLSHLKVASLPPINYFKSFLNMSYLDKMDAQIIDTPNKLYDMADEISKLPLDHVIAYDAETSGLDFYKQLKKDEMDVLATHSLSWKEWQAVIIPVRMKHCKNIPIELINEVVKPILEKRRILAHNGQADVRFNIPDGIDINLQEDTMILIKHLVPFINKASGIGFRKALDGLVKAWRGYDMIDLNKYVFSPAGIEFDFTILNEDYMIAYGCPDTALMWMMYHELIQKLGSVQLPAYKQHVQFARNLAKYATYPGIGVDVDAIQEDKDAAIYVVGNIEKEIYRICNKTPETFNIGSGPQKRNMIYGYFGAPTEEMILTDKGELPVDKNALKKLAKIQNKVSSGLFEEDILDTDGEVIIKKNDLNMMKFPIARLLLLHSDLTKNISSYYNGMLNNTRGRVYNPQFKDGSTDTWRTTDRIQITKGPIKYSINTYGPEYSFASADFAAEEFRLAVNISGDPVLVKMLSNPENDAHTGTAAKVFNVEPQYVKKEQRDAGKTCNFGIIYGMGHYTLAKRIANKDIINQEEQDWGKLCYTKYAIANKPIMKMIERNRTFVAENGFFVNQLGGKMVYPQVIDVEDYRKKLFDTNPENYNDIMHPMGYGIVPKFDPIKRAENRGKLLTISGNYPIQSWAAMILMVVYNKLCAIIEREGLQDKITVPLNVHDEVGLIYHKSVSVATIIRILKEALEVQFDMAYETTNLFIGIGIGNSWGEAKGDIREIPVALQNEILEEAKADPSKYDFGLDKDHGREMQRIIEDYMIRRAYEMFKDMADKRHFIVSKMKEITNIEMYVPKKLGETFAVPTERFKKLNFVEERVCSDGVVRKVPNVNAYISIMAMHLGIDPIEFTYEDGEFDDSEVKETSHLKEFIVSTQIHELVLVGPRFIDVSISKLDREKRKAIEEYLKQFDLGTGEGRQVRFTIGTRVKETDIRLIGLPEEASEDLDQIVNTGQYRIYEEPDKVGEIPFQVNVEERALQIDGHKIFHKYGEVKYNKILMEISKYQGDNFNIDFFDGKENQRLGWKLDSISDGMIDDMLKILRS